MSFTRRRKPETRTITLLSAPDPEDEGTTTAQDVRNYLPAELNPIFTLLITFTLQCFLSVVSSSSLCG
jgi:hypothetical protein